MTKLLFEEWAVETDMPPLLGRGPTPCQLCGDPTGNCVPHQETIIMAKKSETETATATATDGQVVKDPSDEPATEGSPRGTGEGKDGHFLPGTTVPIEDGKAPRAAAEPKYLDAPHADAKTVKVSFENGVAVLDQDTYEEVAVPHATTPTYRLVGREGQTVRHDV